METVDEAIERFVAGNCDGLVAVGGSSSIDTMRAVAVAVATGRHVGDMFPPRGRRLYVYEGPRPAAAMIAVPTTFSASEVTYGGAVTRVGRKYVCAGPSLYVDEIVLDPGAFASTPRQVLVTTGLCALNHALERSLSDRYQELAGAQLRTSAVLLIPHLPALASGEIVDGPALRACIVGAHLSTTMEIMSGPTHALVHVLGARYGLSHGALHGVLLPLIVHSRQVREDQECLDRLRSFCQPLGTEVDRTGTGDISRLLRGFVGSLGAPTCLRELGVPRSELSWIASTAADDISAGSTNRHGKSVDEFFSLLDAAW